MGFDHNIMYVQFVLNGLEIYIIYIIIQIPICTALIIIILLVVTLRKM